VADGYADTAQLVARLARLDLRPATSAASAAMTLAVPGGSVELEDLGVDAAEAERRREAERARVQAEIARAEDKLGNDGFVAKAPEPVVQAERDKLNRLRRELEVL
jgi:valyl-tRNA synthetase